MYGLLKRLETVTYSGHVAPRALPSIDSIGYTYRGEGELDTCTEAKTTASGPATEVTRHFYDGLERRNRTQRYDGYETTFGYDVKGNRTLVRDADGVETAYTYDTKDRLSSATTPMGTTTYSYWEDGLLKTTRYGATMTESRSYDAASRLTVVEAVAPSRVPSLVSRFDYAYDANGNRASQVETRGLAAETTTYGYDEADRLIGVAYPAETHLYQVDAVGNRTGEKRAAAGVVAALTVAAFAALSPAVASAAVERQHNAVDWVTAVVDVKASTTTALSYDANGNRTGEGTKRYAWDIRDTLTRASDGATVLGTYDYDAKLQRVKADTTQGHVEYVLDGKYVLREAGARSRRYHFGEGEALAVTGVGGTSAQDSWLLIDGLGSVVTEANATASSVTARQFDAWGNYRNNTAPTANETRLGYTGHQFDVETGLTYARARYYDSKLGIFMCRDSFEGVLGEAPSLHRFAYTHNNPLRYTDPSGRCAEPIDCIVILALLAWALPDHEPDRGGKALYSMAAAPLAAIAGGLRIGEAAGLRWRNVERDSKPLGRMFICTSYDTGTTKTGESRMAPIHPTLAAVLAEWRGHGWADIIGRAPGEDDLVCPLPKTTKRAAGAMRAPNNALKLFHRDLKNLGFPLRRVHDLRRTFISLARSDGAEKHILKRATHAPSRGLHDVRVRGRLPGGRQAEPQAAGPWRAHPPGSSRRGWRQRRISGLRGRPAGVCYSPCYSRCF